MTSRVYKKYSPVNNEFLYEFLISDSNEINCKCQKARTAFITWRKTSLIDRKKYLLAFKELINEKKDKIIDTIILDTAKPYCEAETELIECCDILDYFCNEVYEGIDFPKKLELNNEIWPMKEAFELYQPCGVFAVIKPWNYPFELSMWAIIPLIIAGNTIVYKPSELSTATGELIGNLIYASGFPEGVFNIVKGDAPIGKCLIENPNIDGVSFTGSSLAGKEIYSKLKNRTDVKLSLEMGGSDYSVVLNDNNETITVPGILWGAFSNAGQVCVSIEKLLVDSSIYNQFISKLLVEAQKLELGVDISPVISKKQFLHAQRIISLAEEHGAKILCGGIKDFSNDFNSGFYLPLTIIECTDLHYLAGIEEVFAPILFVAKFDSENDIPGLINMSEYGLGCSIWTEDYEKHKELINDIDTGMVWINEVNLPMPQVPWIGRKNSGLGVNLSKSSVYESMNKKVIHIDKDNQKREWWYPYK